MDPKILLFLALGCFGGFFVILIIFLLHSKKQSKSQSAVLRRMMQTEGSKSSDAFYQKMYNRLVNIPFVNRYVYKIRRRLELINDDDEKTNRLIQLHHYSIQEPLYEDLHLHHTNPKIYTCFLHKDNNM